MNDLQQAQTLGDIARFQAVTRPDKTALYFEDSSVSYAELDRLTNRIANRLINAGVGIDERVCYLGKNTLTYFALLIAASKAGAVMVPLNWRLAPAELGWIIADTEARFVFTTSEFAATVDSAVSAEGIDRVEIERISEWVESASDSDPGQRAEFESDVLQLYTSGTTGRPKGVRISNRALLGSRAREFDAATPEWNKWRHDDISLIAMPCFHIGGTGFGLSTLYSGATGVIMSQFDVERQIDIMMQFKITQQFIVPSALRLLLNDPRASQIDLSSLKYISYGASPIPLELMQASMDAFQCGFVQKYGMTETSGSCVALGPEDHTVPENPRMGSVGLPLGQVSLKIVDADGDELPIGETGEVLIQSPTNMSGYWRNDDATRETLLANNWLRTGDAGFIDEDGYLFLRDRIKDMIVSGGENVYSAEVEAALMQNPLIAEAAVIGVPDDKWGEAVKAIVVLKDHAATDAQEIIAACRELIAGYKVPKTVDFVASLPRNASGKVLKKDLRAPFWEGRDRRIH